MCIPNRINEGKGLPENTMLWYNVVGCGRTGSCHFLELFLKVVRHAGRGVKGDSEQVV